MESKKATNATKKLAKVFLTPKTQEEMEAFLEDFLTVAEQKHFLERWALIEKLLEGKTQRAVRDELGVSISKVTRGSLVLQTGRGGFQTVWKRLHRS